MPTSNEWFTVNLCFGFAHLMIVFIRFYLYISIRSCNYSFQFSWIMFRFTWAFVLLRVLLAAELGLGLGLGLWPEISIAIISHCLYAKCLQSTLNRQIKQIYSKICNNHWKWSNNSYFAVFALTATRIALAHSSKYFFILWNVVNQTISKYQVLFTFTHSSCSLKGSGLGFWIQRLTSSALKMFVAPSPMKFCRLWCFTTLPALFL